MKPNKAMMADLRALARAAGFVLVTEEELAGLRRKAKLWDDTQMEECYQCHERFPLGELEWVDCEPESGSFCPDCAGEARAHEKA